jgi:hypothetical protein
MTIWTSQETAADMSCNQNLVSLTMYACQIYELGPEPERHAPQMVLNADDPVHPPGHFARLPNMHFTEMLIVNEAVLVLINHSRVPNEPSRQKSRNKVI